MNEQSAWPRILIVEDDQDDILLCNEFIRDSNYPFTVTFFHNCDALINFLKVEPELLRSPAIVLLNWYMPPDTPRGAIERIRNTAANIADIQFGVIVNSPLEQTFFNFDDLGILGFVQKPVTPQGLRDLLDKYEQDFRAGRSWADQN